MAPAGDGMLGVSRTVARGRIIDYEFVQIRVQEGRLVYIAKPARQPEATFTATTIGQREVIFENPTHDFPQRVTESSEETVPHRGAETRRTSQSRHEHGRRARPLQVTPPLPKDFSFSVPLRLCVRPFPPSPPLSRGVSYRTFPRA
jgi:hypothetical protein